MESIKTIELLKVLKEIYISETQGHRDTFDILHQKMDINALNSILEENFAKTFDIIEESYDIDYFLEEFVKTNYSTNKFEAIKKAFKQINGIELTNSEVVAIYKIFNKQQRKKNNPYIDVINANCHDFVEIGGIKWATMNVGATGITDYGLYFAWGDTKGYSAEDLIIGRKKFSWRDYNFGPLDNPTKYNDNDMKTALELEDDAAHVNWGGSWRMPTRAEFVALCNATTTGWTTDYQGSGVAGLVLTDKNDSSKVLFFPAAGYCGNGSVNHVGSDGYYWSSSLYTSNVVDGYNLCFGSGLGSGLVYWQNLNARYDGFSVRGVLG